MRLERDAKANQFRTLLIADIGNEMGQGFGFPNETGTRDWHRPGIDTPLLAASLEEKRKDCKKTFSTALKKSDCTSSGLSRSLKKFHLEPRQTF